MAKNKCTEWHEHLFVIPFLFWLFVWLAFDFAVTLFFHSARFLPRRRKHISNAIQRKLVYCFDDFLRTKMIFLHYFVRPNVQWTMYMKHCVSVLATGISSRLPVLLLSLPKCRIFIVVVPNKSKSCQALCRLSHEIFYAVMYILFKEKCLKL